MAFTEIKTTEVSGNFFQKLGREWALVTVTDPDTGRTNPMTVSWGGMGVLWGKDVITIYIRPERFTHNYLAKTDHFTLSFYDSMRDALTPCGRSSGRDMDKIAAAGLTLTGEENYPWFEESDLVFCCKTLYRSTFDPAKMDPATDARIYPEHSYHDVYIAEIVKVMKKEA